MKNNGRPEPLIEASLADVLAWLSADPELEDEPRRQSMCSLRMIAKAIGRPPELLPARLTAIAQPMARLHHTHMGVTAKTLANHKANVRTALKRFTGGSSNRCDGQPGTAPMQLFQARAIFRLAAESAARAVDAAR